MWMARDLMIRGSSAEFLIFKIQTGDKGIQVRRWATYVLKEFSKKGYIIDKKRMSNGAFFDEDYYDSLLAEIREIRLSRRSFYQKITDIYTTSVDYDRKSPISINFFKKVQNKMHFAVSHQTAAEIILMGFDVVIVKNYLSKSE